MYVWLEVSEDEYELPTAVANTAVELAKILHIPVNTIYVSRVRQGEKCKYKCVEIDDEEDD